MHFLFSNQNIQGKKSFHVFVTCFADTHFVIFNLQTLLQSDDDEMRLYTGQLLAIVLCHVKPHSVDEVIIELTRSLNDQVSSK